MLVISPSGQFYGSEQVLFDYLSRSVINSKVFLPNKGNFYLRLRKLIDEDRLSVFLSLWILYLRVGWLCYTRQADHIYLNEGGHNKYGLLLASLFPRVSVVIHLRILEDTKLERWSKELPHNVKLVSISKFIQGKVPFPSVQLYDPYPFSDKFFFNNLRESANPFKIGIIGRIGYSKGFEYILELLGHPWLLKNRPNWEFFFYGEMTSEIIESGKSDFLVNHPMVKLMGFVSNKTEIYNGVDCILHAAKEEPLGRIFLEAIDHLLPFVGFDSGGIGEIAHNVGYTTNLCSEFDDGTGLLLKLINVSNVNNGEYRELIDVKERANAIFSLDSYCNRLDGIITSNL